MTFLDGIGTQISRDHEEEEFTWYVYSNGKSSPTTVDLFVLTNCEDCEVMLVELTEKQLEKMLQEIRNPKMH